MINTSKENQSKRFLLTKIEVEPKKENSGLGFSKQERAKENITMPFILDLNEVVAACPYINDDFIVVKKETKVYYKNQEIIVILMPFSKFIKHLNSVGD